MKSSEARRRLAAEAARIISESGDEDRARVLRKAASRLGIRDRAAWPDDAEVVDALSEHQRLFRGEARTDALSARRRAAIEAMRFFAVFHPRLTGTVLDGTADVHSAVCLHLHADDAESVDRFLMEHRIPATVRSRRIYKPGGGGIEAPLHGFQADGIEFELTVLPLACLATGPLDANGASVAERADLRAVQALFGES